MKLLITILLTAITILNLQAQDRLKPGAIYEQGDEIYAPRVGYKGVIPNGWFGTLPQEEEVFLLIPVGNAEGYMFINANPMDLKQLREEWDNALSLTDELVVTLKGEPKIEGNTMTGDFDVIGSQKPYKAHTVAIDGGYGWTLSIALLSPVERFDDFKESFDELVASSVVQEPSLGSVYGDFDWAEFLQNKYLMSYMSSTYIQEQDELWLCSDGSFRSKIKSKGKLVVDKSPYKGKRKGTWIAEGIGEAGKLMLTSSRGESVSLVMEIKDDKIFINGNRFFALEYNECK